MADVVARPDSMRHPGQPRRGHADGLLAAKDGHLAELARREHDDGRSVRKKVDVVSEPRTVGELDGREQRVVAGVDAVSGEVEHVDPRRDLADLGGVGVLAMEHVGRLPLGRSPVDLFGGSLELVVR